MIGCFQTIAPFLVPRLLDGFDARYPDVEVDLAEHDMVMLDFPPSEHYFRELLATAGVTPRVRHRSASFEMVRSLVARGRGYSLLIQRPAVELSHEGLPIVHKPIRDPLPEMAVVLATSSGTQPSRRAGAFMDYCREIAPELTPSTSRKPRA